MVRRENSTDRHSEILWVHPTQRGAVLDVWKGLDPQHLKKRTKSVGVRSTHGSFSVTILPWGSRIRIRWCHCVTGFLKRDLHRKFGILFFKSGKNGLSPETFQNGMPIILDEPAYFLVHPIFWWIQFF